MNSGIFRKPRKQNKCSIKCPSCSVCEECLSVLSIEVRAHITIKYCTNEMCEKLRTIQWWDKTQPEWN